MENGLSSSSSSSMSSFESLYRRIISKLRVERSEVELMAMSKKEVRRVLESEMPTMEPRARDGVLKKWKRARREWKRTRRREGRGGSGTAGGDDAAPSAAEDALEEITREFSRDAGGGGSNGGTLVVSTRREVVWRSSSSAGGSSSRNPPEETATAPVRRVPSDSCAETVEEADESQEDRHSSAKRGNPGPDYRRLLSEAGLLRCEICAEPYAGKSKGRTTAAPPSASSSAAISKSAAAGSRGVVVDRGVEDDRRPVTLPCCGQTMCFSCVESDRAARIADNLSSGDGNRRRRVMVPCPCCREMYHSREVKFVANTALCHFLSLLSDEAGRRGTARDGGRCRGSKNATGASVPGQIREKENGGAGCANSSTPEDSRAEQGPQESSRSHARQKKKRKRRRRCVVEDEGDRSFAGDKWEEHGPLSRTVPPDAGSDCLFPDASQVGEEKRGHCKRHLVARTRRFLDSDDDDDDSDKVQDNVVFRRSDPANAPSALRRRQRAERRRSERQSVTSRDIITHADGKNIGATAEASAADLGVVQDLNDNHVVVDTEERSRLVDLTTEEEQLEMALLASVGKF